MKYLPVITATLLLSTTTAIAQQTRKTNDSQLLQYYQNQQFKEALNYLRTLYTEPVTDLKELSNLAYTASMANKLPDAESYYQRIYDADTSNLKALYNIAAINLRRGNSARASIYYQNYITRDSSNFQVFKQMAHIMGEKFDIMGELKYLRKANHIDSTDFDVASDLGDLYVKLDSLPQAEKVLNIALVVDPENVYLLESLLQVYSSQKKWPQAVAIGEKLFQFGDFAINTVNKTGKAYYQLKNYECGLESLLRLLKEQRTETTAYFIGACYKELKDQKNAIIFFGEAIKLSISPASAAYYSEMADSYEILNQLKKALVNYQKSLLYKENPLTYYFLATLYDTKLKDKRSALKYFKKYAATKPSKNEQAYWDYTKQRIAALSGK